MDICDWLPSHFSAFRDQAISWAEGTPVFSFGIEIEIIAEPHIIEGYLAYNHAEYYKKLSDSIKVQYLRAASDPLQGGYQKHPEHYDKWWITRDGSLKLSNAESFTHIPIEAVSPIFKTNGNWAGELYSFWESYSAVFKMPQHSVYCGSHFHISRGRHSAFTLRELKIIAFGIVFNEPLIDGMLVRERWGNPYCQRNRSVSWALNNTCCYGKAVLAGVINDIPDKVSLCHLMQAHSRHVLWNFQNTLPGKSGTIEFRGGPCLRGPAQTLAWAAFSVALVQWLLYKKHILNPRSCTWYTGDQFYAEIQRTAYQMEIGHYLPPSYTQLNEAEGWRMGY
ncbi:swim zinc finger domain protein [Ophiostoma piceae UAMH 11346]|uniref:Swim zinc finger domain protein n=1 Tax=Ophiostoma piceae (strain UAMH 11346) TaxID=1262450 RepID=S3CNE1_OPHP1|nr:swim zinc finger domain protein [Ophiostoma piceae UAMH 11346]